MAAYRQIQDDVKKRHGRTVKTCWIAHVNELNGLRLRLAPNRRSRARRQVPCPPGVRPLIEASMRRFHML